MSAMPAAGEDFENTSPMHLIYHEPQEQRRCGLHAVNNLLQGPFYTSSDMDQIARRLDRLEKDLVARRKRKKLLHFVSFGHRGCVVKPENKTYLGDYSMQVMQIALERFSANMVPVGASGSETAWGLVVNSGGHWFAYRRVSDEHWVNVNSMLERPKLIKVAAIKQRIAKGFVDKVRGDMAFCIIGNVPPLPEQKGPCVHSLQAPRI